MATAWSGAPSRETSPTTVAISARMCRLSSRSRSGSATSPGSQRAVSLPAAQRHRAGHVRLLVQAAGDLQRAAADVEVEQPAGGPAEPAADRQEGEPGLVLAGEHPQFDPGLLGDPAEHLLAVGGLAHGGGGEGQYVDDALVLGDPQRGGDHADQLLDPGSVDRALLVEEFGEPQLGLVGVRGQGCGARVGVDHQEVDRVGTYVEYTESHNPPRYAISRRRRPVVPVFVLVRVLIAAGTGRPGRTGAPVRTAFGRC